MATNPKIQRSAITKPIGRSKAAKFAAIEGVTVNQRSYEISQKAASAGLRGDAYRAEIKKAFTKS